jgi:hypothetical protein
MNAVVIALLMLSILTAWLVFVYLHALEKNASGNDVIKIAVNMKLATCIFGASFVTLSLKLISLLVKRKQ